MMLRNSSQVFIHQSSSRKFLEVIEDVLENPQTAPAVRERLLTVVAAAAHPSVSSELALHPSSCSPLKEIPENDSFRGLWKKVKPPGKPDNVSVCPVLFLPDNSHSVDL